MEWKWKLKRLMSFGIIKIRCSLKTKYNIDRHISW
jgi:hypothetical protein